MVHGSLLHGRPPSVHPELALEGGGSHCIAPQPLDFHSKVRKGFNCILLCTIIVHNMLLASLHLLQVLGSSNEV